MRIGIGIGTFHSMQGGKLYLNTITKTSSRNLIEFLSEFRVFKT